MKLKIALGLMAVATTGAGALPDLADHHWRMDWKRQTSVEACQQAIADGYYTPDLLDQCIDDYNMAGRP